MSRSSTRAKSASAAMAYAMQRAASSRPRSRSNRVRHGTRKSSRMAPGRSGRMSPNGGADAVRMGARFHRRYRLGGAHGNASPHPHPDKRQGRSKSPLDSGGGGPPRGGSRSPDAQDPARHRDRRGPTWGGYHREYAGRGAPYHRGH